MITHPLNGRRAAFFPPTVVILLTIASIAFGASASAAELADQARSLRQVPADAAFYSSSLRLKEQWEAFTSSKAYSKLMEIPLIQLGKMQATFQWQQSPEPTIVQIREYLESPAGKDAVFVLREMVSEEIFAYGGSNLAETIKFAMEMNAMVRGMQLQAGDDDEETEKELGNQVIAKVADRLSSGLAVPTFVIGFRIKDAERANRELDEVHSQLRNLLDEHQPDLAAHLQREQIERHEFLTLRLDGSMIPWEKIREDAQDDIGEEQFDKIRDALSKHTLVVALGIVDEFVLLSVGENTDHLTTMGKGASLAEQPAIKRLEKHAAERVVSIGYVSQAFAQSLGSAQQTIDDLANTIDQAMREGDIDEADRKTIVEDVRALDLARYFPEPGETSMIGYLTSRGYEAYQYATGKRLMMDSSKPLSILHHVGGSPLVLLASRSKQDPEDYARSVDWLKRIAGHVEQIAEKKADPDDWAKYQEYRERGIELLERLDRANRDHLIPALADGQGAFILDLTATSKQWFEKMPESPKPLPVFELGLVTGVSDAEQLRQGVKAYIGIVKDAYKLLREIEPNEVPKIEFPKAKVSEIDGGRLYAFPLPEEWGVDEQVALSAGLTDTFAAVSPMPATTKRLLTEQKPSIDTALPLDRPAAAVTHVEFAKFIAATRPWMDYGMDVAMGRLKPKSDEDSDDDSGDEPERQPPSAAMIQMGLIVPQVQQFLDVATALRSATTVTYEEDGLWVTRSETHIEDLK